MAGNAITRKRRADLEKLGEEELFKLYLRLGSVRKVAKHLWKPHGGGDQPGYYHIHDYINADEGRKKRWQEVKKLKGHDHAEQALELAMETKPENARSQKIKVDTHKWYAGRLNTEYADGQGQVNVQVNMGVEWLRSLEQAEPQVVEAEVVEEEEGR